MMSCAYEGLAFCAREEVPASIEKLRRGFVFIFVHLTLISVHFEQKPQLFFLTYLAQSRIIFQFSFQIETSSLSGL